jgi:predicted Na+-dependent transporter
MAPADATLPPLSAIIVAFGLIFVITAALASGLSVTVDSLVKPLRTHAALTSLVIIGNYVFIPGMMIGFLLGVHLGTQPEMGFALLGLAAGSSFAAWITSLGVGDVPVATSLALMLTVLTMAVVPLGLPGVLSLLDTHVTVSAWTFAWPLLAFIAVPLVAGVAYRARYPRHAAQAVGWLGPVSLAAFLVHVMLVYTTYWGDFIHKLGGGDIAVTLAFPFVALTVGYILSPPYVLSPVKPANPRRGSKLAAAIATAQRGTVAVVCSVAVAFRAYPIAGVAALTSTVVTLFILAVLASEWGRDYTRKTPAPPTAG